LEWGSGPNFLVTSEASLLMSGWKSVGAAHSTTSDRYAHRSSLMQRHAQDGALQIVKIGSVTVIPVGQLRALV